MSTGNKHESHTGENKPRRCAAQEERSPLPPLTSCVTIIYSQPVWAAAFTVADQRDADVAAPQ